jgi:hypothetical protein
MVAEHVVALQEPPANTTFVNQSDQYQDLPWNPPKFIEPVEPLLLNVKLAAPLHGLSVQLADK